MLNQDPRPCPVCFCNASRSNEGTCTAWNIATHATDLNSRSCFVLNGIGLRVKAEGSARASATRDQVVLYDRRGAFCRSRKHSVNIKCKFRVISLTSP